MDSPFNFNQLIWREESYNYMAHFLHMLLQSLANIFEVGSSAQGWQKHQKNVSRLIKQKAELFLLYQNKTTCQNVSKQVKILFTTT